MIDFNTLRPDPDTGKESSTTDCECAPDCCDTDHSSCGCSVDSGFDIKIEEGIASIDGIKVEVTIDVPNLVELGKKAGVIIPAPCYSEEERVGCCKACIVEVNGEQKYACGTAPQKGMQIVVNKPDLKALRKERVLMYKRSKH